MKKLSNLILPLFLAGLVSCSQSNSDNSNQATQKPSQLEQKVSEEPSNRSGGVFKKMKKYLAKQRDYVVDIGPEENLRFKEIISEQTQVKLFDKPMTISPYAMMETEVTWKQFKVFVEETNYRRNLYQNYFNEFQSCGADPQKPVTGLSTENAIDFCKWLQNKVNLQMPDKKFKVTLPSIEQYLYAMTEGKPLEDFQKQEISTNIANLSTLKLTKKTTERVKSYPANSFGLYEIIGNAREYILCQDWRDAASAGGGFEYTTQQIQEGIVCQREHNMRVSSYSDSRRAFSEVGFRPILVQEQKN